MGYPCRTFSEELLGRPTRRRFGRARPPRGPVNSLHSVRRRSGAHHIGCKPMAIAAAQNSAKTPII